MYVCMYIERDTKGHVCLYIRIYIYFVRLLNSRQTHGGRGGDACMVVAYTQ